MLLALLGLVLAVPVAVVGLGVFAGGTNNALESRSSSELLNANYNRDSRIPLRWTCSGLDRQGRQRTLHP